MLVYKNSVSKTSYGRTGYFQATSGLSLQNDSGKPSRKIDGITVELYSAAFCNVKEWNFVPNAHCNYSKSTLAVRSVTEVKKKRWTYSPVGVLATKKLVGYAASIGDLIVRAEKTYPAWQHSYVFFFGKASRTYSLCRGSFCRSSS